MSTVKQNIEKQISLLQSELAYNHRRIFKRAHYLKTKGLTFSEALKQSWLESKQSKSNVMHDLNNAYMRLSKLYSVKPTPEFEVNQIESFMLNAYKQGISIR